MSDFRPATCWPAHCFCEQPHAGPVLQPVNASSSVAFVLVALAVWRRSRGGPDRVYAAALATVGLASAWFHAGLSFWGQTADVLGMYLVASWFLLAIVAQRRALSARATVTGYLALNLMLLAGLVQWPAARRYVFAALVLLLLAAATRDQRRALGPAVAALAAAFTVWAADLLRWWCTPTSVLQGHAVWHLGAALAAWLAWERFARAHRNRTLR